MTALAADYVTLAAPPRTVAAARQALEPLPDIAARLGVPWDGAVAGGTDGAPVPLVGPDAPAMGTTDAQAVGWGIGWFEQDPAPLEPPEELVRGLASAKPHRRRVASHAMDALAPRIEARRRRRDALIRVASEAGPAFVVRSVQASFAYPLAEAFRRWLAFGLAYEEPLAAGSATPLRALDPMLRGDLSLEGPFGRLLNLARRLDQALAFEAAHGSPHPAIGVVIRDPAGKRAAVDAAVRGALPDARDDLAVARDALLAERDLLLDVHAGLAWTRWGAVGGSALFG